MGPEAQVQDTILGWLAAERILAFRMQVGAAVYGDGNGGSRRVSFGTAGMADILSFPKFKGQPLPCWLEVKSDTGRQSALQVSFADQVESDGHAYMVVRSVDDVVELMKELQRQ